MYVCMYHVCCTCFNHTNIRDICRLFPRCLETPLASKVMHIIMDIIHDITDEIGQVETSRIFAFLSYVQEQFLNAS